MGSVWLLSGVRPTSSSPSIDSTHQGSNLHCSSTGQTPEYASLTIFPGFRYPFFKLVLERGTHVFSRSTKRLNSPASLFRIWRMFLSLYVRPAGTLLFDFCSPFLPRGRRFLCLADKFVALSPPARDILPALVTILRACAPDLNFLQDFAELCVDVPYVAWPILAPGLGG